MTATESEHGGQFSKELDQRHKTRINLWRDNLALLARLEELDPSKLAPSDLFVECSAQEKLLAKINMRDYLESLDKFYLFSFPLFGEGSNWANELYPLQFTIGLPKRKSVKGADNAARYSELLSYLKKLDEPELRWLLIARWLYLEGVCEPEDILPSEVLQRVIKRSRRQRMKPSPPDLNLWRLVRIWRPYFEKLLTDRQNEPKSYRGPREALLKLGYTQDAIESALDKSSTIQAAASWFELRKVKDAHTVEKAYSRVEVAMRKVHSDIQKLQAQQSDSSPV